MKIFILIFLFCFSAFAQYSVRGRLVEKGKKINLSEINVYVLPDKITAVTSRDGQFELSGIVTPISKLIINASGYKRFEKDLDFNTAVDDLMIYLEKENTQSDFEVDAFYNALKRDQSQKTLTRKQIFEMPGANGDPVKAVQNLPGISRTQGFSSNIVIQGSAPKDTAYDFEGHEIPLVFHFGGLTSVVMPEAVEQVDYFSAGYQSDRSRALGGIISLKSRKPEVAERSKKGLFYLDNLSSGGLFEAQIDEKSSFLISGRYSYIGAFLKAATKDNEALNLTVAPEFMDLTAIYARKISETEEFKLSLLGSRDKLAFVLTEPLRQEPSFRGNFSNTVDFFRIIPQWTKVFDPENKFKFSVGVGQDKLGVDIGDRFFKIDSNVVTLRSEWERKLSDQSQLQTGIDSQYADTHVKLRLPITRGQGGVNNPISSSETREADIKANVYDLGFYAQIEHKLTEKFKFTPGLRYDRFSTTKEDFILPRLSAQYTVDDSSFYKFGSGLYVQSAEPQESSAEFGNPDIKSPRALHVSFGYEKDFRQGQKTGSVLGLNSFYRKFDNLVIQSSNQVVRNGTNVFEVFNNDGEGRAYGAEVLYRRTWDVVQLMISYTWSKSVRSSPGVPEYDFEYDQTHNLNMIASYDFLNSWKLSGRYRYVTGNPETPVVGSVYDADNETYFPIRGPFHSIRNRDFQQFDLRIDKKWVNNTSIWTVYLDIQNVLNIKNSEGVQYSYDYSVKEDVTGLPVIPALGVRGEF